MTHPVEAVRSSVARTVAALRVVVGRRDGRAILAGVTGAYLLGYLVAIGHLGTGFGGVDVLVVADPAERLFRQRSPFSFEPIARVALGPVTLLLAPLNVALGLALAGLVGANLAVSYLVWRHPAACGIDPGAASASGILAGLPALLSGAACCGPALLLVLGVQASAGLIAAFGVLVPVAAAALLASLLFVGRQVDPVAVGGSGID